MDGVENRLHRLKFNIFTESATESLGSVSWANDRVLTTDLWNEDLIWGRQDSILQHVAAKLGLPNGYLSLVYVFYPSRKTQTRFFVVEEEVFVVRDNGTLESCGSLAEGDRNLTERVLDCDECRWFFEFPLHTRTLMVKWSNFCRTSSDMYTTRDPVSSFGVACPEKSVATKRSTEIATESVSREVDLETEVIETSPATSPVLAAPIATVAVILTVGLILFAFRDRLGRCWDRDPSVGY